MRGSGWSSATWRPVKSDHALHSPQSESVKFVARLEGSRSIHDADLNCVAKRKADYRHWPVDLLELNATITRPVRRDDPAISSSSKSSSPLPGSTRPLKLILHLSSPPQDKLTLPPGIESCRSHFTSQVKEADFVRWGNTKRVTGMRRQDLEAGWDGVVGGDYDLHSRMGSRLVPMPIALGTSTPSSNIPSRPPSTEPGQTSSVPKLESAYAARSLPIKVYLPDASAMQHVVAPLTDGKPTTLLAFLRAHYPLLFPTTASEPYALAVPYVLGIVVPPDSEVAWLASCMCGADGWVRIGIGLIGE